MQWMLPESDAVASPPEPPYMATSLIRPDCVDTAARSQRPGTQRDGAAAA